MNLKIKSVDVLTIYHVKHKTLELEGQRKHQCVVKKNLKKLLLKHKPWKYMYMFGVSNLLLQHSVPEEELGVSQICLFRHRQAVRHCESLIFSATRTCIQSFKTVLHFFYTCKDFIILTVIVFYKTFNIHVLKTFTYSCGVPIQEANTDH